MTTPADFQEALDTLGTELGKITQGQFDEKYEGDWPDEESTTHQLLGGLVVAAKIFSNQMLAAGGPVLTLRATATQKHKEKRHGVDALIRFRCDDPLWRIDTVALVQAKRREPGRLFDRDDQTRLREQLVKMLTFTSECFVMVYSAERGICIVPAVAAYGLQGRDLFDLAVIPWSRFLSGILRGRFGDVRKHRVPDDGPHWTPMFELDLVAEIEREESVEAFATA